MKTVIIGSLVAFTSLAQAQTFATDFNSISDAIVDSHVLTGSVGSFSAGATTGAAADIGAQAFGSDRVATLSNLGGPVSLSLSFILGTAVTAIAYDFWASSGVKVGAGTGVNLTLTGPGGYSQSVASAGLGAAVGNNTNPSGIQKTGSFVGGLAGTYTLTFTNFAGNNGFRLDDVRVVATPVPELQSAAMLLAGLSVLGFLKARRKLS